MFPGNAHSTAFHGVVKFPTQARFNIIGCDARSHELFLPDAGLMMMLDDSSLRLRVTSLSKRAPILSEVMTMLQKFRKSHLPRTGLRLTQIVVLSWITTFKSLSHQGGIFIMGKFVLVSCRN